MNLLGRLLWTLLFSRYRKPVSILGPCQTPFRCVPTDLDALRHMTNSKYLAIMDLARVDLMIRSGFAKLLSDRGWYPVVAAETIRFRKSLKLFDSFVVETSVIAWDEKAFILLQRFLRGDACVAEAVVRARFLKKTGGTVKPSEIVELYDITQTSPVLSPWLKEWNSHHSN